MNVRAEKLPKSRVKLTVELETHEVQPYLEAAARDLSKEHPVKGFRPGAVPFDVVRSAVGDKHLVEKALQELVPKTYVETLMDRGDIEAIGRPEVTALKVTLGEPWKYEATVAVLPEVRLGDHRRVRAERREPAVAVDEVDQELEVLRKMRASFLTVLRPSQMGDRVDADITATVDRVPLENGSARAQPILLGEGHLIPGFEDHLLGMREGETKTFSVAFPENHHQQSLRGRTVEFTVTVRVVQQRILPELSDAFAQGLGKFTGLHDLREKLTENIRTERTEKERERLQLELLHQVVQSTTFGEFPDLLVESEVEKMIAELTRGLTETGLSLDQYLQQIGKTLDEVRRGLHPQALERVRAGLTLRAVAKTEGVTVDDDEVAEEAQNILRQLPDAEEAKKRVDVDELTSLAAGTIRNRKVFALLEKFAGLAP